MFSTTTTMVNWFFSLISSSETSDRKCYSNLKFKKVNLFHHCICIVAQFCIILLLRFGFRIRYSTGRFSPQITREVSVSQIQNYWDLRFFYKSFGSAEMEEKERGYLKFKWKLLDSNKMCYLNLLYLQIPN